jgi:hypothetical protein
MPTMQSPIVRFRYTQAFRARFRTAFVNATGAVFIRPDIQGWASKYPADSGFPAFGYVKGNPGGGENILTWQFTIPIEVQFPEPVRVLQILDAQDTVLVDGELDAPFVKMRNYPGVVLLNWWLG